MDSGRGQMITLQDLPCKVLVVEPEGASSEVHVRRAGHGVDEAMKGEVVRPAEPRLDPHGRKRVGLGGSR